MITLWDVHYTKSTHVRVPYCGDAGPMAPVTEHREIVTCSTCRAGIAQVDHLNALSEMNLTVQGPVDDAGVPLFRWPGEVV